MHTLEFNLKLVRAMLEEFEDYLLSNELFWPLDPSSLQEQPPLPRLTPGGLILAFDELDAQTTGMSLLERTEHQKLDRQMQRVFQKWPEAAGRKAAREMHSRFNLWKAYVNDLLEREDRPDNYAYEVRQRVIFERITQLAVHQPDSQATIQAINPIDASLQTHFKAGEFIWDPCLRKLYPEDRYWFLYGVPVLDETT
jgi:hypothetical protein